MMFSVVQIILFVSPVIIVVTIVLLLEHLHALTVINQVQIIEQQLLLQINVYATQDGTMTELVFSV